MNKQLSTSQVVKHIKQCDSDFEYYPTALVSVESVYADAKQMLNSDGFSSLSLSILDIGAGRGDFLNKFEGVCKADEGKNRLWLDTKFAIEKSQALIELWNPEIICVGTDFNATNLLDKSVPITFCNPPYSQVIEWTTRILKESNSRLIYFVIPESRVGNDKIQAMLDLRKATATVIDTFDFKDGERKARAKAVVLRVDMFPPRLTGRTNSSLEAGENAFNLWFDEFVPMANTNKVMDDWERSESLKEETKAKVKNEVVASGDLVRTMERLYVRDMNKLIATFKSIGELDSDLLVELDVNVKNLREALKMKIRGLKNVYWSLLFENFTTITNKLTASSRDDILRLLNSKTNVDFTESNIRAITVWVIKKFGLYAKSQLVSTFEKMVELGNVTAFKSNKKVFSDERWRFNQDISSGDISHFKLDYRIVLQWIGTIKLDSFNGCEDRRHELEPKAANFFNDLLTIASNLNFDCSETPRADAYRWCYGQKEEVYFTNSKGEQEVLFDVRFYKNRNAHIRFNTRFIQTLNVEYSRLKGWIRDKQSAVEELEIPPEVVEEAWGSNIQIGMADVGLLLGYNPENETKLQ